MSVVTYPLNNVTYSASDVATYNATRSSGVFADNQHFAVTSTSGLGITIDTGIAWVKVSKLEGHSVALTSPVTITLDAAHSTLPRIDRIVIRFSVVNNESTITVLKGTPASTPVAPSITQSQTIVELGIYDVLVNAGATSISLSNITDQRANEDVCGLMRDAITRSPVGSFSITTDTSATWTTATSGTTPSSSVCDYFQSLALVGITSSDNVIANLSATATGTQRNAASKAGLFVYSIANDSAVICVRNGGLKPTIQIPIEIIVLR